MEVIFFPLVARVDLLHMTCHYMYSDTLMISLNVNGIFQICIEKRLAYEQA